MAQTKKENEEVAKDYFWVHKIILRFCGVSLQKKDSILYKIYSRFIFCLVTCLTFEEIYTALKIINDLTKVADLFSICISHILGFLKLNFLLRNRILIIETLDTLHTGVFFPNVKRGGTIEMELIKGCTRTAYVQMVVYYGPLVITMINAFARAMASQLNEDNHELWEFPWVPFKLFEVKSAAVYYIVYTWQSVTLVYFAFIIMTIDLLICAVYAHMTTQFHILTNFLKILADGYPGDDKDHLNGSEKYKQFLQERLRSAAIYHQEIIHLTERFEYLFNMLVLAVYVGDGIVICFCMYLSTIATFGLTKIISEVTYLIGIIAQLGLYCYFGNELTLASDTVSLGCYNANFVGTTVSFQKGLLQIMIRSQRPIILTAGKFANLSLPAFVTVMRASYSYFMVMKGGVKTTN